MELRDPLEYGALRWYGRRTKLSMEVQALAFCLFFRLTRDLARYKELRTAEVIMIDEWRI